MPAAPPCVMLLGPAQDPTLARVAAAVAHRGGEPVLVDSRQPLPMRLWPGQGAAQVAGRDLGAFSGALVRALPPRNAALAQAQGRGRLSADAWLRGRFAADGSRDAACALLRRLEATGGRVLNPPRGGAAVQNKLDHLDAASAAGLRVPATFWGTRDDDARTFVQELLAAGKRAVHKPARAGGFTEVASPTGLVGLDGSRVVQERIEGADVRVLLLEGGVLSAVRLEGVVALDYRADPTFQAGRTRYVPLEVPGDVREALGRLQRELGMPFAGADLKETADGELVFLELNGAPIFDEQEERTGHPIAERLALHLVGGPSARSADGA